MNASQRSSSTPSDKNIDIEKLDERALCKLFDHTLLKPYATRKDFEKLCAQAREHGFMMVAINSGPVALCKKLLEGSNVHVGAAISFPLGAMSIASKCNETLNAINDGAERIGTSSSLQILEGFQNERRG